MTKTIQIKLDDSKPFDKKLMDHKNKNYPHLTYTGYIMELIRKDAEESKSE
jgi:hypothetical protein